MLAVAEGTVHVITDGVARIRSGDATAVAVCHVVELAVATLVTLPGVAVALVVTQVALAGVAVVGVTEIADAAGTVHVASEGDALEDTDPGDAVELGTVHV